MKVQVYPVNKLSREHLSAWSEIQLASSECDSPYFRPEFHQLAGKVGRPVLVGVMKEGDRPVGFFPFERGAFGTARPVARRLSDFHGAIVAPGVEWCAKTLLQGCGLRRFCFDHLVATQKQFITGPVTTAPSPVADLSDGFPAYWERLRQRGERELDRVFKKRKKMERQFGPIHFCLHQPSHATLAMCIKWKSSQYQRTGALNCFRRPWAVELLRLISSTDSPHFSGVVSTLSVQDELVAVHVGMRSASVFHHWFPAHNSEHLCAKHSPGLQLLTHMLEGCASTGIGRIDFGKGDYSYKRDFGTGELRVAEGECGNASLRSTLNQSLSGAKGWCKTVAERVGLITPIRWYRGTREWLAMR